MTQVALILNPVKVDDAPGLVDALRTRLADAGWPEPMVLETTVEEPGEGLARSAVDDGAQIVIAAGGDGTVASVISGLAGSPASLVILPAGTGNLLARNLGLPMQRDGVLDLVLNGHDSAMDIGEVTDGPQVGAKFAVMAGLGFDAAVMTDAPENLKATVGWPAYVVAAFSHLGDKPFDCTIVLDGGEPMQRSVRTVLVANVATLQGGIDLAPDAGVTDGLLDVVVVAPQRATDWIRLGAKLVFGNEAPDAHLERFQAHHVAVITSEPVGCQLDGDPIGDSTRLSVAVRGRQLRVRLPRGESLV